MQHLGRRCRRIASPMLCYILFRKKIKSPLVQLRLISSSSAHVPVRKSNVFVPWFVIGATATVAGAIVLWNTTQFESRESPLHPETFAPFTLVSREAASPTSSIITLEPRLPGSLSKICSDAWKKGVWSVQVKQPQLQIARSYTPLPPIQAAEESVHLRFLIRWEPQGEVSTYLHKLFVGATVDLRGPHIEYTVPDEVDEVLFIAGGTGIAPALQVAYNLFENRESPGPIPRLRILWANRRREDSLGGTSDNNRRSWSNLFYSTGRPIKSQEYPELSRSALVQELEALKDRNKGNITVDYFCDEEDSYITQDVLKQYLVKPEISTARSTKTALVGKRLILISGPEGFVNYHAGPKTWAGGQGLQGSLGGTLKELDTSDWVIWKI